MLPLPRAALDCRTASSPADFIAAGRRMGFAKADICHVTPALLSMPPLALYPIDVAGDGDQSARP